MHMWDTTTANLSASIRLCSFSSRSNNCLYFFRYSGALHSSGVVWGTGGCTINVDDWSQSSFLVLEVGGFCPDSCTWGARWKAEFCGCSAPISSFCWEESWDGTLGIIGGPDFAFTDTDNGWEADVDCCGVFILVDKPLLWTFVAVAVLLLFCCSGCLLPPPRWPLRCSWPWPCFDWCRLPDPPVGGREKAADFLRVLDGCRLVERLFVGGRRRTCVWTRRGAWLGCWILARCLSTSAYVLGFGNSVSAAIEEEVWVAMDGPSAMVELISWNDAAPS